MRGKRIRGRVAGNKTEREAELERTKAAKEVEATLLEERKRKKERESQGEGGRRGQRERSGGRGVKGIITPAGWVAEERE